MYYYLYVYFLSTKAILTCASLWTREIMPSSLIRVISSKISNATNPPPNETMKLIRT